MLFPDSGITKGELCAYYEAVAPVMVPHLRGRPITMERYPAGIEKKGFIQKDVSKGFPAWLARVEVEKRGGKDEDGPVHYPLVRGRARAGLARQPELRHASRLECARPEAASARRVRVRPRPFGRRSRAQRRCETAALAVRDAVGRGGAAVVRQDLGLERASTSWCPSTPRTTSRWRGASRRARARVLVKRHPDILTQEFIKADRAGRIFVDTGRNAPGATFAAAYAVRPKPGAPVSAPCTWEEVERDGVGPRAFTLRTMATRLAASGDLWKDVEDHRCSLRGPMAKLDGMLTEDDWKEALAASTRRPVSRRAKRS